MTMVMVRREELREALGRRNLSQSKFAKQLGRSPGYLSDLLQGKYQPSAELRDRMLAVLNDPETYPDFPVIQWDDLFVNAAGATAGEEEHEMPRTIRIFDTTLRDGEQSPGASMNIEEKLEVARQLARLGVDVIEAGFPISSDRDFQAVQRIAREVKGPIIAGLCRATEKDIQAVADAIAPAERRRIHTFLATSDIHMEYKLRKTREEVLAMAVKAVTFARTLCDDVEFSAEDATRSDVDFLCKMVEAVIDAGATTVNIPDTVGYAIPDEFGALIATIRSRVPNVDKAVISVHCHNDLGLAVANSLAAVRNGAGQVECTINGLGERAGNAALEEVVMAMRTRPDHFPVTCGVNAKEIVRTSRLVSDVTTIHVQPNKAIVGANAFSHESGIHQHGMLAHKQTYEIMNPEDVGAGESKLVLGIHSGKHAIMRKLFELGYELDDAQLDKVVLRVKEVAEKKKEITERDLESIATDETTLVTERFHLDYMHVVSGFQMLPTATVRLLCGEELITEARVGVGSVDSVYKTIDAIADMPHKLVDYVVHSVTGGTDALGEVTVRISNDDGRIFTGRGASTDIIDASAKAYVQALNRLAAHMPSFSHTTDMETV
ncbi:MAG: 2-isopropylmalate synthase [Armatimonadota bacterium]